MFGTWVHTNSGMHGLLSRKSVDEEYLAKKGEEMQ